MASTRSLDFLLFSVKNLNVTTRFCVEPAATFFRARHSALMTKNRTYVKTNLEAAIVSCLAYLVVLIVAITECETALRADDGVTVVSASTTNAPETQKKVASDGTPEIHKSLHKKKHAATQTASDTGSSSTSSPSSTVPENQAVQKSPMVVVAVPAHTESFSTTSLPPPVGATTYRPLTAAQQSSVVPGKTVLVGSAPAANPVTPVSASTSTTGAVPAVETGLPVARYPGMGTPIKGVSTYIPAKMTLPGAKSSSATSAHQPVFASTFPGSVIPATSTATGLYSNPNQTGSRSSSDFVFTNYEKKVTNRYAWKTGIITTMFWIGEGSTPMSSTNNVQSSWDEDWLPNNHGSDSPYNRNGYAAGGHASTLNPFYIALPFNDLAFPDKAHDWVPRSWRRPPKDGKQVSACKDRWIEIKNAQGHICYAQWEDVGPLRYDHAEYVFGPERPIGLGDDHAGLDVSPAVAQYLGIDGKNRITSWRFVDDEDVRPGP